MATPDAGTRKRKADNTPEGETKKFKSNYSGVITVSVGSDNIEFTVHQDLICDRSPFFKAACSRNWTEAKERRINLPDQNPKAIKIYFEWAYSQRQDLGDLARAVIKSEVPQLRAEQMSNRSWREETFIILRDLWVLADYLGDNVFKNITMDSLIDERNAGRIVHNKAIVHESFERTRLGSQLQTWIADRLLTVLSPDDPIRFADDWPLSVALVLLSRLLVKKGRLDKEEGLLLSRKCDYHEHADGAESCDQRT
ncbi:hypothetical protein LTR37_017805 [Vermiconidia calcicola]|uniref:Uncharacterized protein n=1 Tax=Vermiconidia calcicola TaxID=1690605 RepID=A0ACC3MIX4_9PEZI|nr:hypothetical protein LTR37_017805 [Vermiconidia calcicola]